MSTATAATTTRFLTSSGDIRTACDRGPSAASFPDARVTSGIDRSIGIAD
jgi:hypothetical protein